MESITTPKNWLDVWLHHRNVTYGCMQELLTNCLTNSVGKALLPFQKVICCCLLGLDMTCLPILKHVPFFDFFWGKVAHFLHDFHSSSFPYLAFEESNGEHNQLTTQQIQNSLGRTQTYVSGGGPRRCPGELNIHSLLRIGHTDFGGEQYVWSLLQVKNWMHAADLILFFYSSASLQHQKQV
jgi:hypothetical protein